jgi:hypothetical protein
MRDAKNDVLNSRLSHLQGEENMFCNFVFYNFGNLQMLWPNCEG